MKAMWHFARRVVLVAHSVSCLGTLLGFAALRWWPFHLFDHPRLHYVLAIMAGLVVLVCDRRWAASLVSTVFLAANLWVLMPSLVTPHATSEPRSLQVMHSNLGHQDTLPQKLINYVKRRKPDLLCLQEVTPEVAAKLTQTLYEYQLHESEPRNNTRGIALLVLRELPLGMTLQTSTLVLHDDEPVVRQQTVCELASTESSLTVLNFHCKRPIGSIGFDVQSAEYAALAEWFIQNRHRAAVAIGDFNATPWSQRVRHLVATARLPRQSATSLGPTWPTRFGPFGIPLDFCIHNASARVRLLERGPCMGSDHLPVCYEISW